MPRVFLCFLSVYIFFSSCRNQNELFTNQPEPLRFSEEAIVFDTILAGVPIATKRLKVYNPNKKAVRINEVFLGSGSSENYSLLLNAEQGIRFNNVSILGGDSLLIIVRAAIQNKDSDEVYQALDSIVFELPNRLQNVKLLTWAENVHVISGDVPCNAIWTAQRPYLLKGNVSIPSTCSLRIEKGTRVYAFNDAILENFGYLDIAGSPDSNVILRYFRKEANFSNVLGVWRGLRLRKASQNILRYAEISNANVGILVDSTNALLEGVRLQSMSEAALVGFKAKIFMRNSLINNSITRLLQASNGGEYELVHCTLANYEFFFNRQEEAGSVFINQIGADTMKIRLFNNIFWGNLNDEMVFSGEKIALSAANNIFRTRLYAEALNTNNNLVNVRADSLFSNPRRFDYSLPSISPAISKGISTSITTDILGKTRKNPPDIGAFER
ncbi:MAG: hypothetical protein OHK0045_14640 [Raineya sp.]